MVFDGAKVNVVMAPWRRGLFCVMSLVSGAWPLASPALTLGPLELLSSPGQALMAEIAITESTELELKQISAKVADQAAHEKAAIPYGPVQGGIAAELITKTAGQNALRLRSEAPMPSANVDILLQVNWGAGQILKEYRLNLKRAAENQAAVMPTLSALPDQLDATRASAVREQASVETALKPIQEARPVNAQASVPNELKPVTGEAGTATARAVTTQPGDTAYKLIRLMSLSNATPSQLLLALMQSNPHAFLDQNVNRLRSGVVIDLEKARQEVLIDAGLAQQEIRVQNDLYSRSREEATQKAGLVAQVKSNKTVSSGLVNSNEKMEPSVTQQSDRLEVSAAAPKSMADTPSLNAPSPAQTTVSSALGSEPSVAAANLPVSAAVPALTSNAAVAAQAAVSDSKPSDAPVPATPVSIPANLAAKKSAFDEHSLGWLLTFSFLGTALILAYYLLRRSQHGKTQQPAAKAVKKSA
jgi:pilus assembly protein FimV